MRFGQCVHDNLCKIRINVLQSPTESFPCLLRSNALHDAKCIPFFSRSLYVSMFVWYDSIFDRSDSLTGKQLHILPTIIVHTYIVYPNDGWKSRIIQYRRTCASNNFTHIADKIMQIYQSTREAIHSKIRQDRSSFHSYGLWVFSGNCWAISLYWLSIGCYDASNEQSIHIYRSVLLNYFRSMMQPRCGMDAISFWFDKCDIVLYHV